MKEKKKQDGACAVLFHAMKYTKELIGNNEK